MTEDLGNKILEAGLKKLEELKVEQHRIEVEICALRYQVQDACPHKVENIVDGAPVPRAYDYQEYMPPFRVCKKCGYAEFPDQYGRFSAKMSFKMSSRLVTGVLQIRREEALQFARGHIYNAEAVEKIALDRAAAARTVFLEGRCA